MKKSPFLIFKEHLNSQKGFTNSLALELNSTSLTLRLSGLEILNDATSIFQNWLLSRFFTNIFYNLNFTEEDK